MENKQFIKIALFCGAFSSLLRVATDFVAGILYPHYSFLNNTMSQLAAIGAPTRSFQIIFLAIDSVLVIIFGIGVLKIVNKNIPLRFTGIFLTLFGLLGLGELPFSQTAMQLSGGLENQTIHIIVTSAALLFILFFIGFGAFVFGKRFRIFSILTILVMLIFGYLAGSMAPDAINFAAPFMGLAERISFYPYLLWVFVFALMLKQEERL